MPEYPETKYVPALRFHFLTPIYDAVVGLTTRERTFKTSLVAQICVQPEHRVLDLACGTGTLAIWLKQSCPETEIAGVDGDERILSIARRKAETAGLDIGFHQGLSHALPYPDGYFDQVTSSLFFHHLSWADKQRTARELYRVIRPGGRLHVADWGSPTGPVMRAAFLGVQLLDGFKNTSDNISGKLPQLFRDAGFSDVIQTQSFSTVFGTLALYRGARI